MKFAICNETFQDWPFEKAFAFARECGYTGIEIAPFTMTSGDVVSDALAISPTQRSEVRSQAEAAGLQVVGLHWLLAKTEGYYLTSPDGAVRRKTAEYLCHLALLCRDLGGSVMVFGSPDQRSLLPDVSLAQANDYAVEVIREAMPILEDCQVTLAIEPLAKVETDFLTNAAEAVALINRVESPNCRLNLDVKAMAEEPLAAADMIRLNAAQLAHLHANDPNRQGPGFGEADFVPIFEALGGINYDGWVSVEVFDYSPGIERLARESIEYMRDCLAKAGGQS